MTDAIHCQVLVAGAGVAGTLAAVAAARAGAEVLLVEERSRLGGVGEVQSHRHLCGLYLNDVDAPAEPIHGPLVREVVDRLQSRSGARGPERLGRTWVWPLMTGDLPAVLGDLVASTPRLQVLRGTHLNAFAVASMTGEIAFAGAGESGPLQGRARAAVDGTGTAALAGLAGWPRDTTPDNCRQLAGLTVELADVQGDDPLLPIRVPRMILDACSRGALPADARVTVFIARPGQPPQLRMNLPDRMPAEQARELAEQALLVLSGALPAFERARATAFAPLTPRDAGRVHGRYRLTAQDVLSGQRFPDAIARGAWPVETWLPGHGPSYAYGRPGAAYDIPLRCLLSPAADHVLFAGRSISCDPEAFASVRVMGLCMATGEAAGREAARRAS